jgi:raffinose/stachyose/melibiose transport system permease protein
MKKKVNIGTAIIYIILLFTVICVVYPIFLLLINSTKNISDFYMNPIGLPRKINLGNYVDAFIKANMKYALPNNLYLMIVCETILILFGSLAAYPIARIKLKMNQIALRLFLLGMIIPAQVIIIPVFIMLRNMHLLNSLMGLSFILVAMLMPLTVFIYSGFYKTIPYEIEEAAIIDGCGILRIFFSIIFPLSKTATASVLILTSLNVWREFFFPLILISKPKAMTLSVALFSFENFEVVQWTNLSAAMVIMAAPILILFLFGQKYFVKGAVSGAVKG